MTLIDPWVTSDVTSPDNSKAELTARAEVRNLSGEEKRCELVLSIENISFRQEMSLQPHETRSLAIDKTVCAALAIENPRLWWPNGYGDPVLHRMEIRIESGGLVSNEKVVTFGKWNIGQKATFSRFMSTAIRFFVAVETGGWKMEC